MARRHIGRIPYAGGISVLDEAALQGVEGGAGPGGDADLGIEVLDVVVGGLGRDVELPGGFLCRRPAAISRSTSISRGVSPAGRSAAPRRDGWPAAASTASTASGQSLPSRTAARSFAAAAASLSAGRCGRASRAVWKASAAASTRAAGERSGPRAPR